MDGAVHRRPWFSDSRCTADGKPWIQICSGSGSGVFRGTVGWQQVLRKR